MIKTMKLVDTPLRLPDKNLKILIKKGSTSEETSLQDLEESFAFNSSWKAIERGEVVSIPVVEFRTIDQHKPDAFEKTRETQIEHYSVTQTISDLEALVLAKFNEERVKFVAAQQSEEESERNATIAAKRFPLTIALRSWFDAGRGL